MKLQPVLFLSRSLVIAILGSAAVAQTSATVHAPEQVLPSASALASLPAAPAGRATVIGGEIRDVDAVRDQFMLKVFGGKSMKILFDERTQFYRDGVRISVLDLHANDRASVETTLEGTKVFALRIHITSQAIEGELQGQVASYDSQTGDLAVMGALSTKPVTVHVPAGLQVSLVGQQASSRKQDGSIDLVHGSIVDVKFRSASGGHGVVTHIDVIAVPGSTFAFSGNLSTLDVHAGRLVITDPRDSKTHEINYDPLRFPVSRTLQQGSFVRVNASFDGSQYVASEITIE
jgi:YD repeat-containing protein